MTYDLFISYPRRDNAQGRITQLVELIKADFAPFANRELVHFFDQQEIHGMSDWRQRILQGLRESRLLLACLSPAYLQIEYCEWEFVEYLKYEIGRSLLYHRERPPRLPHDEAFFGYPTLTVILTLKIPGSIALDSFAWARELLAS